eukprot:766649-Hanusia_phi.AAC.4
MGAAARYNSDWLQEYFIAPPYSTPFSLVPPDLGSQPCDPHPRQVILLSSNHAPPIAPMSSSPLYTDKELSVIAWTELKLGPTYLARHGDTLDLLASRFGTSSTNILEVCAGREEGGGDIPGEESTYMRPQANPDIPVVNNTGVINVGQSICILPRVCWSQAQVCKFPSCAFLTLDLSQQLWGRSPKCCD